MAGACPWRDPSAVPVAAPPRYRLAIFDFDGTLADSWPWLTRVFNKTAERYRFRQVDAREIEMLRGQDTRAIVRYLGVPGWKLPMIAHHMRQLAAQEADKMRLFHGVEAMLRDLAARGVILSVVSSNAEATIRRVLGAETAAMITHYECQASIFGKASKIHRIIRQSSIDRRAAIGIGDETRDIEAARKAGIASGAVVWGYATQAALERAQPEVLFQEPGDVTRYIAP